MYETKVFTCEKCGAKTEVAKVARIFICEECGEANYLVDRDVILQGMKDKRVVEPANVDQSANMW